MTNVFNELCSKYLGEDIMSATPQNKPVYQNNTATKPQAPQPSQQNQQNQNSQIEDQELFNILQQKMADEKFKQAFSEWLKTQQQQPQNAA